ncbi:extracellular solute-binding protein, family 3 [Shewanella psychrophila]|uniref:Extracellular solute-binding protein, family 3 n=1 Tax=Shewanella psychrophila TaxID=225848 RepID=A0A1S6HY80_9GAMM|nr:transporter substrate-binding domain-containing protein [Shewanella psychrophila]AQS40471.1 extracellular solute-binding protein, family 3 [Shewanella psychrophila]
MNTQSIKLFLQTTITTAVLSIAIVFLVLKFSTSASANGINEGPLLIATQEWPPYQMLTDEGEKGHAIDALKCVLDKLNKEYRLIFLPWGRAQKGVETGKYHAFFSAAKNTTRDGYATFSTPFIQQDWDFYQLASSPRLRTEKHQFSDATFGSRPYSNTTHWLLENHYKVIHQSAKIEELISLLQQGKIEAMMDNRLLFKQALDKLGIPPEQFSLIPNKSLPLGIYFGHEFVKQHPQFLPKFNQHTQACQFTTQ